MSTLISSSSSKPVPTIMASSAIPFPMPPCPGRIFGTTPQVLETAGTLLRLVQLNSILPQSSKREQMIESLKAVGGNAQKCLSASSPETAKEAIRQGFEALNASWGEGSSTRLYSIYNLDLSSAATAQDLQRVVLRLLKDTASLLIPPAQKSDRGVNGPTLLISHLRLNNTFNRSYLNSYVVKWINWNEFLTTKIYRAYSKFFAKEGVSPFLVPEFASLNFETRMHEMTDGSQVAISTKMVDPLKDTFLVIAKTINPELTPTKKIILFSERVVGENLFDFARHKYQHLSLEQKPKLFIQLGQLALLDMLIGNADRLIRFEYDFRKAKFRLEKGESNLGNLMVSWCGNISSDTDADSTPSEQIQTNPILYAIDNGIGTGNLKSPLIEDASQRKKYLEFLDKRLNSPKPKRLNNVAKAMTASIQADLDRTAEETANTPSERPLGSIKAQLQPFSDDLNTWGPKAFQKGFIEMLTLLRTQKLPSWESEQTQFPPEESKQASSNTRLKEAVLERFKIIQPAGKQL